MASEINEKFDLYCYERGLRMLIPDLWVDQNRMEHGASHDDGSACDYQPAESLNGLVDKCILCGDEIPYVSEEE